MIMDYLKALGFSEKEIQVYKYLSKYGLSNVQTISRNTNISRTTIYPIVNKLMHKGLVSKRETRNADMYMANEPSTLLSSLLEERAKIIRKESIVKQLIEASLPYFHPKLEFYETEEEVRSMLKKYMDLWISSAKEYDGNAWGYLDPLLVNYYRQWFGSYVDKLSVQHIHLFTAAVNDAVVKNTKFGKLPLKHFPINVQLSSTILVHGDYVTMLVMRSTQHYAFQLHDKTFAQDLQSIFKLLWGS